MKPGNYNRPSTGRVYAEAVNRDVRQGLASRLALAALVCVGGRVPDACQVGDTSRENAESDV